MAVSYTHLDVYKRQVLLLTDKENNGNSYTKNHRNNIERITEFNVVV